MLLAPGVAAWWWGLVSPRCVAGGGTFGLVVGAASGLGVVELGWAVVGDGVDVVDLEPVVGCVLAFLFAVAA